MPTKAVIYTRFSPRPDADESDSCERQEAICREYCAKKGYEVVAVEADHACSGDDADRPGLWRAVDAVRRGWVLVVRWRSRLAREVYLSEVIRRAVDAAGGTIEAAEESNGDQPTDILVRQILAAFAEYEKKIASIRTKYAMQRHQKAGRRMSKIPPYGWRLDPDDSALLVRDDSEQAVILLMRQLRGQGLGWRAVAKELNERGIPPKLASEWTHKSVAKIIERGA